jgi:hypothetical protein
MQRERLLGQPLCGDKIASVDGHDGGSVEGSGAGASSLIICGKQALESRPPFGEITAHVPEAVERARELQGELGLT